MQLTFEDCAKFSPANFQNEAWTYAILNRRNPRSHPCGHARQELKIRQGLEGNKAKEIIQAIKSQGFKVQSQLQDQQIRVTGKKKDELQEVIQYIRNRDFGVAINFKNFRD